jgi:lipopolysaccharide/colanic/teichoic acid biosynthesis glycosyltransferase
MRESSVTNFIASPRSAPHPAQRPLEPGTQPPLRRLVVAAPEEPRALEFVHRSRTRLDAFVKRGFDIAVALLLLSVLLPLFVVVALAIKLDSRGPVFYRARRVGRGGREFGMLKFRKMHESARGMPLTTRTDDRLTRVGRVLTRTRVDELPQLWDVLRGRMSVVGPRPEDPGFVALRREAFSHVLKVRPGITGLSQLAYAAEQIILKREAPVEDYLGRILPQKLSLDALYAESRTLRMDLEILRWTFATVVLHHPVAVNRKTGAMGIRRRPKVSNAAAEAIRDAIEHGPAHPAAAEATVGISRAGSAAHGSAA